jgi:hypothetical protein
VVVVRSIIEARDAQGHEHKLCSGRDERAALGLVSEIAAGQQECGNEVTLRGAVICFPTFDQ